MDSNSKIVGHLNIIKAPYNKCDNVLKIEQETEMISEVMWSN